MMSRKPKVELSSGCTDNRLMGKSCNCGKICIFKESEREREENSRRKMNILMGTAEMRWVV